MADTLYDAVGGAAAFEQLIDRFYAGVENDPVLRPLYPEDMTESAANLRLFLIQYFGGPHDYHAKRGHPRLRHRHVHIEIGQRERDAWVSLMRRSLDELALEPAYDEELWSYLQWAADTLINVTPAQPDRALPIADSR